MTGERKLRLKNIAEELEIKKLKETTFKQNNKEWPPSQHYIYINHEQIEAETDDISEDWAEKTIFNTIIQNILKSDSDYINSVWCQHAKGKISEDIEDQIEYMYKQSEGNCNPSDTDLLAFIDYLKSSSDPKEKEMAEKGVEDREIFNLAKEKIYNDKKNEKLMKLRNEELMMKSSVMAPYFTVDVDKTFYEEVKEEIFASLLPNQYCPDISQLRVHQ